MLVNGKLDEGDVILDDVDGYLKINFKNIYGVWYTVYIGSEFKGDSMWVSEGRQQPTGTGKVLLNIKKLLTDIRKDVQNEPSN